MPPVPTERPFAGEQDPREGFPKCRSKMKRGVRSAFISSKQELIGPTICKTFQGLSKDQMELCHQYPDVTSSAMDGLQLAVEECQYQFQWHRWNCSSLSTKNKNPHSSVLLQREIAEMNTTSTMTNNFVQEGKAKGLQENDKATLFKALLRELFDCNSSEFLHERWNFICRARGISMRSSNFSKSYRETAFAYAISSAGVAHSVARACSSGKLIACGCDPSSYRQRGIYKLRENQKRDSKSHRYIIDIRDNHASSRKRSKEKNVDMWKWGGCSHNLDFGVDFSQSFLDLRERAGDIQSRINLHNNEAGRLAVSSNVQIRCKCHGYSGSCELKTCWKAAPEFRLVGEVLKERFRSAIMVDQSNTGSGSLLLDKPRKHRKRQKPKKRRRRKHRKRRPDDLSYELFYYQKSPNFCEKDASVDFPGTTGRQCNKTSRGLDSCSSMCCGRGYNRIRERRTERQCQFKWCCEVICHNHTTEGWITVCK